MKTFLKLLRYGFLGMSLLFLVAGLALVGGLGWTAWQISRSPEIEATLTYLVVDEQGVEREVTVSLEEGAPEGDMRRMLAQGSFQGTLKLATGAGFKLLGVKVAASAPLEEILRSAIEAAMEEGLVGKLIGQMVLGEEVNRTVGELLQSPPEGLVSLLGAENYEEVLSALSGGDPDKTLGEVFSGDLGQILEELPEETVAKMVDGVLGEEADKTLDELLAEPPGDIEGFLGSDYEQILTDIFGEDADKSIGQIIVENPSRVVDLIEKYGAEIILRQIGGGD